MSEIDIKALWRDLDAYERELSKEKESLVEVWHKISEIKERSQADAQRLNPSHLMPHHSSSHTDRCL
jgi:hypothetical protein